MKTHWRKFLRDWHRDIGYLATGLTIVYAISGVAVNHTNDWNPNYVIEKSESKYSPMPDSIWNKETVINEVMKVTGKKFKIKNTFRPDPNTIQIFAEGNTLTVNNKHGIISQEIVKSRAVIRETNFLHLNNPKKVWTYVADIFAVALIFLAVTGLFLVKGRNGIKGRGAWLTTLGFLIPVIFLLIYYY